MTNTTNATAHASCSHPRTKVARAICRRQRAQAPVLPQLHTLRTPSGVVHEADFQVHDMTYCNGSYPKNAVQGLGTRDDITCKNCIKRAVSGG
jgi:hypothetical protein